MDYLILAIGSMILISTFALLRQVADVRNKLSELGDNWEETESFPDELETEMEDLSDFERYMERRNAAFNERIKDMREELYTGTVAEELHPLVKNLPHESVRDYEIDPPDVEYID